MANLHWKTEKTDRDTTIRMLMETLPDYTPSAFKVRQEGDDSGAYMCVYVERTEGKKEICKELPQKFEGWRIVQVFCPFEYIKYVMDAKRE
tara:strand:- start:87 stop:359 length:273 start_codon:yes stop_codon:yes gene_type:complete